MWWIIIASAFLFLSTILCVLRGKTALMHGKRFQGNSGLFRLLQLSKQYENLYRVLYSGRHLKSAYVSAYLGRAVLYPAVWSVLCQKGNRKGQCRTETICGKGKDRHCNAESQRWGPGYAFQASLWVYGIGQAFGGTVWKTFFRVLNETEICQGGNSWFTGTDWRRRTARLSAVSEEITQVHRTSRTDSGNPEWFRSIRSR